MNISDLKKYKLIYLSSPYTLYKPGPNSACRDVCVVAARLMREGLCVISPIAHSHMIAAVTDLDPFDEAFWAYQDAPLQSACDAMVVVKMRGWEQSKGVSSEIAHAVLTKQPLLSLDPKTYEVAEWVYE